MNNYWNNLNEREKWMVIAAALCFFLYAYYAFLYSPLSNAVTRKSVQLTEKIETLAWMKKVNQEYRKQPQKKNVSNTQLLTLLASQLKEERTLKFPYQLQQTHSGDIELSFDQVPFNLFIQWLAQLSRHYVLTIKQFDASKTETAGVSKLAIIISAGT